MEKKKSKTPRGPTTGNSDEAAGEPNSGTQSIGKVLLAFVMKKDIGSNQRGTKTPSRSVNFSLRKGTENE